MKIHPTFVKQSETSATGQVSLSSFLFIFPRNGFSLRKVAVPSVQSAWHGSRLHTNEILPYQCIILSSVHWMKPVFSGQKNLRHSIVRVFLLEDPTMTALAALILTFPISWAQAVTSAVFSNTLLLYEYFAYAVHNIFQMSFSLLTTCIMYQWAQWHWFSNNIN